MLAQFMVGFYFRVETYFRQFPLWMAAGMGGVGAGVIGLLVPSVIGTGYGWAQFAIDRNEGLLPLWLLALAVLAEITAASDS